MKKYHRFAEQRKDERKKNNKKKEELWRDWTRLNRDFNSGEVSLKSSFLKMSLQWAGAFYSISRCPGAVVFILVRRLAHNYCDKMKNWTFSNSLPFQTVWTVNSFCSNCVCLRGRDAQKRETPLQEIKAERETKYLLLFKVLPPKI